MKKRGTVKNASAVGVNWRIPIRLIIRSPCTCLGYLQSSYPVSFDSGDHLRPDDRIPPITRRMITHVPLGACSARWGQCSSPRPAKPVMKWRAFCFGRRLAKWEFHEHRVMCPFCRSNVTVVSLMERLVVARRTCPACRREFYGQA